MADENKPEEEKKEQAPVEAPEATPEKPEEKPAEEPKEKTAEKAEAAPEEKQEKAKETPKEEAPEEKPVEGDFVMANVALKPGLTVRIHQRLTEGEKSRVQVFEGIILKLRGATPETKTVTVRKIASGVGVEKIFPLNMPTIEKVELVKQAKVRRNKLYYLRDYKKKLSETLLS